MIYQYYLKKASFPKITFFGPIIFIFCEMFFPTIATSQDFAFFWRGHGEGVKYWQMPSPKTSLFTTIWPDMVMTFKNVESGKILENVNS